MSLAPEGTGRLIWASRGRTWGFRFLLDGGFDDPLTEYERVFAGHEDEPALYLRVGDRVALRFLDPEGRADASGRAIPHEFVVMGELADQIVSVDGGEHLVWPMVEGHFAAIWDAGAPPSSP